VLSSSLLFHVESAQAAPSVNVALRASFDAAPYLVELLYVGPDRYLSMLLILAQGKPPPSKMPLPTSLSSMLLRKGRSWT
jgi:hypothetical protein